MRFWSIFKKILLWSASSIVFTLSLIFCTSFACIFGFIATALLIPIDKWQNLLKRFLKTPIKIIVIVAAILTMIIVYGVTADDTSTSYQDTQTSVSTTAIPTETAIQTEATSVATLATTSTNTVATTESENATEATTNTSTTATKPNNQPTTVATTKPAHTHKFSAATCTSPKTCSCGATEGSAKGHDWEAATCIEPKTCIICGETKGSVAKHNYSNGSCDICGVEDPDYYVSNQTTYVLNVSSMKFHKTSCNKLPTNNRQDTNKSREEVINEGYTPCKLCNP